MDNTSTNLVKSMIDFSRDATTKSVTINRNNGMFDSSLSRLSGLGTPEMQMQSGGPSVTLNVKSVGDVIASLSAQVPSKRSDSVVTAIKPAIIKKHSFGGKSCRFNDVLKTNGIAKHGISGAVSSAEVAQQLLAAHQQVKLLPVEVRPIQPALNQLCLPPVFGVASPGGLPISFFQQQAASVTPGQSSVVFIPQENGSQYQAAGPTLVNMAPTGHAVTGSQIRFPLPTIHKPLPPPQTVTIKSRNTAIKKPRTAALKWLPTIKPELKPKTSSDAAGATINGRPQGALQGIVNGSSHSMLTSNSKRQSIEEDPCGPKKKSKKKHSNESQNVVLSMPGTLRLIEGSGQNVVAVGSCLSGVVSTSPLAIYPGPTDVVFSGNCSTVITAAVDASTNHASLGSGPYLNIASATKGPFPVPDIVSGAIKAAHGLSVADVSSLEYSSPLKRKNPGPDERAPDRFCQDLSNSTIPVLQKIATLGNGIEENGAYWKKTNIMYNRGVQKSQQINHEAVIEQAVNVVDFRTVVPAEKPVLVTNNPNRDPNSRATLADSNATKKTRKPRSDKGISPRLPKAKKERAVVTTTKTVPIKLDLKRQESDEQKLRRLKRLAHKWPSVPEDSIRWLVATKSMDQMKVIRWLRLVDRAFMHAESAKNHEKMERLRDSKIQAIMDLEKLQAPFEPRLMHFLHPKDLEKKTRLIRKYYANERVSTKETKWLKEHYERLQLAEVALPGFGASTDRKVENSLLASNSVPAPQLSNGTTHAGNERGNFQSGSSDVLDLPRHTACLVSPVNLCEKTARHDVVASMSGEAVQATHQFVRKFPDSTKAVIEVDQDEVPCAVLLLIQWPNCKAVHIKKSLRLQDMGVLSKDQAFSAAVESLNHLVKKYLGIPSFPILVRYPLSPGYVNDHLSAVSTASQIRAPVLSFNRDIRGWEHIQFIESAEAGISLGQTINDQDFDLSNDIVNPDGRPADMRPSLLQDYRRSYPAGCAPDGDQAKPFVFFGKQISAKRPVDLTAIANDPVEQRRWLCWELRHVSQQYFDLNTCQIAREHWYTEFVDSATTSRVPEATLARAFRFADLTRDGLKKPKASTALVNKTIKMGEQVKDVLDSYKKERPMTRRKKAAKMSHLG